MSDFASLLSLGAASSAAISVVAALVAYLQQRKYLKAEQRMRDVSVDPTRDVQSRLSSLIKEFREGSSSLAQNIEARQIQQLRLVESHLSEILQKQISELRLVQVQERELLEGIQAELARIESLPRPQGAAAHPNTGPQGSS